MTLLARSCKRFGDDPLSPWRGQARERSALLPLLLFLIFGLPLLLPLPARAEIAVPNSSANGPMFAPQAREKEGLAWSADRTRIPPDGFQVKRNGLVSYHLRLYQTRKRDSLLTGIRNAEAHLAQIKEHFERAGLPPELSNLAFPESSFNPYAYSRVGAAGIWQLMESTARLLGLQVNWWVDERRDPEKSTQVAIRYLKELYRVFGAWPLAIAAYNAGEAKVRRALRERPRADLWSLRLPRETLHLVSAFLAVTLILQEPENYSFPAILEDSPRYTKVSLDSCTDVRVIARACEVAPEEILELNPELNWGCTPPDRESYEIRIPMMAACRFEEALSSIPPQERIVWTRHKVREGDTLFRISR
ncbi:MAG: lytic transglycosylase domain-containing protein, partial [candidate division NC10 bacterium]|nr:lytic transglycosylase domain-containing protein [candidate division NC10 bacterium]